MKRAGLARAASEHATGYSQLLRRCLAKDRRERLPDIADARLEINETLTAPSGDAVATTMLLPRVPLWRRAVAPTLTLILGGLIVGPRRRGPSRVRRRRM